MLAIDVRDSDIMDTTQHRQGGVTRMLAALHDAGLRVIRIEPRTNESGMYRVTLTDSPELAVRILEAIRRRVSPSVSTAAG
jgi:transcription initiation factor IIE alpha subunit